MCAQKNCVFPWVCPREPLFYLGHLVSAKHKRRYCLTYVKPGSVYRSSFQNDSVPIKGVHRHNANATLLIDFRYLPNRMITKEFRVLEFILPDFVLFRNQGRIRSLSVK